MKRKILYCLLTVVFTLTLIQSPVCASSELEEKVSFNDENIKKEIINALIDADNLIDPAKVLDKDKAKDYEPTIEDMANLKHLR